MSISDSVSRFTAYYARHGFGATKRRAGLALRRGLFANRMVVFSCDLSKQALNVPDVTPPLTIERLRSAAELNRDDLEAIISLWHPQLARRNMNERFAKGASLWIVKSESRLAGYGWTLEGGTIEPYFFPLRADDAHFFDFHVFSEFRGQGINPLLVGYILRAFANDGRARAFIEAAEWNEAQLSSLRKTPFRRLGSAVSFTVFGRKFTKWANIKQAEQTSESTEHHDRAQANGKVA
jgi:ribosomal protein S18 acetylase RimI-like enzyme